MNNHVRSLLWAFVHSCIRVRLGLLSFSVFVQSFERSFRFSFRVFLTKQSGYFLKLNTKQNVKLTQKYGTLAHKSKRSLAKKTKQTNANKVDERSEKRVNYQFFKCPTSDTPCMSFNSCYWSSNREQKRNGGNLIKLSIKIRYFLSICSLTIFGREFPAM